MAEVFDPYDTWLGIGPEDQPPDYYRLLAIKPFEEDPAVIASAADRQMKHLRDFQTGPHSPLSQRLLNEVAAARICLLNKEKKAAYDEELRQQLAAKSPARKLPVAAHAADPEGGDSAQETVEWTGLRELGEYRLLEKLGAGGMGEVYKALHTEMQRVVAVKVLPRGHLQNEHAVARFKREIRAIASLNHPNIVQAHDAREIEGTRFLVMEYVDGMDLRDVAKRLGPLPVADACELIRQAAMGLQCAHEHGLVHRDIKPGNLMLTAGGQLKVLDLGLARPQSEEDGDVTGSGEAMGTPDYMAPEQVADSRSVDIRADVYGLGCTLYRLVAGQPPFWGPKYDTAVKKLIGHTQDAAPKITRLRRDVPKQLEIVLGRMLAKDPAKRLSTPVDVADALGPLSVGADLPGLYAAATGQRRAAPAQAEAATHAGQSAGLTRFLDKVRAAAPAGRAPVPASAKRLPAWTGYAAIGGVAVLLILAVGVWMASGRGGGPAGEGAKRTVAEQKDASQPQPPLPRPTPTNAKERETSGRLVLDWPADQRDGAVLEINDQRRDLAALLSRDDSQTLDVHVKPGGHRVWIVRRGYEPFEETVTVEAGKIATVRPTWKKVAEVAVVPRPEPKPVVPKPEEKPSRPDPTNMDDNSQQKPEPGPTEVAKPEPAGPETDPAVLAREQRWLATVQPAEKLAADWDFAGAEAALARVTPNEPELQPRLARRREELKRMATFKGKMISRINAFTPRLKKSDLMLRGINGEVTGADDGAIHAQLGSGKAENHPWAELNDKARPKLLQLAVDLQSTDDLLAAGLIAFASGDVALAEKLLDKAKSMGIDTEPYLGSLAAGTYAEAGRLMDEQKWPEAQVVLTALQDKYGNTPWFLERRSLIASAVARARSGNRGAEAEELYAKALTLLQAKDLFELREIVQKLRADYPAAPAVTDASRKPTFAELAQEVANLGERLTVRQDGKGDFQSIQAAIDAAKPNSLIEIQDSSIYSEKVTIPGSLPGLQLRGKRGCWPQIASLDAAKAVETLVLVQAENVSFQRIAVLHETPAGPDPMAISVRGRAAQLRQVIVYQRSGEKSLCLVAPEYHMEDCVFLSPLSAMSNFGGSVLRNCLLLGTENLLYDPVEVQFCTCFGGKVMLHKAAAEISDSILSKVEVYGTGAPINAHRIERTAFTNESPPEGSRDCFQANPMFANPANLDFRLAPGSPCRGKAGDKGDLGCRYTPDFIEVVKATLNLRAKKTSNH